VPKEKEQKEQREEKGKRKSGIHDEKLSADICIMDIVM
jgi:hypothetical protein